MSNFHFYKSLGRCPECPNTSPVIHGDGPTPCKVMCIGEAPGGEEEAQGERDGAGRPFVGRAGKEFNENYLPRAGFTRTEVYMTNSVKCRPDKNKTPSDKLRNSCAAHFISKEVELVQPELILLMGSTANKLLANPYPLERMHGFPYRVTPAEAGHLGNYSGWVDPMYHPAAGMHNTSMMSPLLEDFTNLGRWLRELWDPPVDEFPTRDYQLVEDVNTFTRLFHVGSDTSIDTESDSHGQFWSSQFSQFPGTGYMIMASNEYLTRQLIEACTESSRRGGLYIAQNTTVDYEPMYRLGMVLDPKTLVDTMQLAFQHGNMPQGLKSMSMRLTGVHMRDFEDVVMPSSLAKLHSWLDQCLTIDYTFRSPKMHRDPVSGQIIMTPQPGPLHKKILELMERCRNLDKPKDAFKYTHAFYHKRDIGPRYKLPIPPMFGIEHVTPFADALFYACQDPDLTLRCYYKLMEIAARRMSSNEFQTEADPWRELHLRYDGPLCRI